VRHIVSISATLASRDTAFILAPLAVATTSQDLVAQLKWAPLKPVSRALGQLRDVDPEYEVVRRPLQIYMDFVL